MNKFIAPLQQLISHQASRTLSYRKILILETTIRNTDDKTKFSLEQEDFFQKILSLLLSLQSFRKRIEILYKVDSYLISSEIRDFLRGKRECWNLKTLLIDLIWIAKTAIRQAYLHIKGVSLDQNLNKFDSDQILKSLKLSLRKPDKVIHVYHPPIIKEVAVAPKQLPIQINLD